MARSKKTEEKKVVEENDEAQAEHPYYGYQPPAVADRVEIRVNDRIVYLDEIYGAAVEVTDSGVQVKCSKDAPRSQPPEQHFYNPTTDELPGANTVTDTTESTVPATDPEYTEELAKEFDDDDA